MDLSKPIRNYSYIDLHRFRAKQEGFFIGGRRNPHRSCYTRKRKSQKLRNYDRWCRNNQPWLGGGNV